MPDRYAVIGHPVAHSRSPAIHAAFAAGTGEDIVYDRVEAPLTGFADTARRFFADGGRGLNVTVPFKEQAFALVDVCDELAIEAGAVNTIRSEGGRLQGFNTDGLGLVRDLTRNIGRLLAGKRILLLGAGGAGRGVVGPLLRQKPEVLCIVNRTIERAQMLVAEFNQRAGNPIRALRWNSFRRIEGPWDIVINATSAGLRDESLPLPHTVFGTPSVAYEMVYGRETLFMRFARERGATIVSDGLGMLVEQAAESFLIWRGTRPRTEKVIEQLRAG
jgi:shikimate dehydrogenase